jgi:hypothetical protein
MHIIGQTGTGQVSIPQVIGHDHDYVEFIYNFFPSIR